MFSRVKPRGIALNIMQQKTRVFLLKKKIDNIVRSDDTIRSIILFAIR